MEQQNNIDESMEKKAKIEGEDPMSVEDPISILSKKDSKVQSLTISDQHATLLISHTVDIDYSSDGCDDDKEKVKEKTVQSLLKLTVIPFHKILLGSNPVLSSDENGKPELKLLQHKPEASQDIMSFLSQYEFVLKSESGAEYSYYTANPTEKVANNVEGMSLAVQDAMKMYGTFDVELISPASEKQIFRAMPSLGSILIHETPELYEKVTKPYIQSIVDSGSLGWIANVIEVKKEKERLLVNHEDFIVNIDTKWRSHPPPLTTPRKEWFQHPSVEELYCLGITKRKGIASLRDLRREHIPMLKSMEEEGYEAIESIYGVKRDQIRCFVHYHPQFYHFHVHFTRLENEVGSTVERGHLVSDIIQNLEIDPLYYLKRTITYKLKKGNTLQNLIEMHMNSEAK